MNLEHEIQQIKARNKAVESNKAWEVSVFRRVVIMVFTYVGAYLFMTVAELPNAWLASFVPTFGYLLSTLSLPPLRNFWVKNFYK